MQSSSLRELFGLIREVFLVGEAHMMLLLQANAGSVCTRTALFQCRHFHNPVSVSVSIAVVVAVDVAIAAATGFRIGTSSRQRWRQSRRCGRGCRRGQVGPLFIAGAVAARHIPTLERQSMNFSLELESTQL